jgi:archaellum component FlaG (FlaF/FlaG flagellin family)
MRNRDRFVRPLMFLTVLLACVAAGALAAPMTRISIVLKDQAGKPVDHASVVVRFVQGHSVVKLGKAIRTTFELRSNQEGEARIPSIPQGKILVQVIAKGFQTFGQTFDITEEEKTLDITLNPPQQQYSAH